MIKKHKNYSRPKKPFDTVRIKAENVIVDKYGLKNKREIWKSKAKLDLIRRRAKKLLHESTAEEQKLFLEKLSKLGYVVGDVVDVLALTEEDVLDRRLQTVLLKKEIATTAKGARQLITHKHILVNGKVVNIPSYHVSVEEEKDIKKVGKVKLVKVKEEAKEENVANVQTNDESKVSVEDNSEVSKIEEKPMEVAQ